MRIPLLLSSLFSLSLSLKVLQITDFHMDVNYNIKGDKAKMCHVTNKVPIGEFDSSTLGQYGDYMCDSPEILVEYVVNEAVKVIPSPDLILWTGDSTPHVEGYGIDYVVSTINTTTSILFNAFKNVPILPTFGNHDYAPSNAFVKESNLYATVYDKLWKEKIGEHHKKRFYKGGYYSHIHGEHIIMVLNTNLYYIWNDAYANFTDPMDPAGQFAYMEEVLDAAEQCSKRKQLRQSRELDDCPHMVHIAAHIGPGAFERTPNYTWFRDEYNSRFLSLIERYNTNVKWMIFGHHHTDTFHVVRDASGVPINTAWMAPAVTPWFSDLIGAGSNNPAFRVYEINNETGDILDFTTYSVNLPDLNNGKRPPALPEYSFKSAYNLDSLSPQNVADLVDRFGRDDELFMKYITYNSVGWNVTDPKPEFRNVQLCSMAFSDYPRYYSCTEGRLDPLSPQSSTNAATTPETNSVNEQGILSVILLGSLLFL